MNSSSTALSLPPSTTLAERAHPWLDRTLYPFTPSRFATKDGDLSYVDVGRGPVVLLVHGTPSWSFEWRSVIRKLAPTHRVLAVDHLGFGLSDKPEGAPLRPSDHAERLASLVRALDLRDVTLVVHDFGGPIGLPLALSPEGRVRRVVVLNSWMWSNEGDRSVARIDRLVRSWLGRFLYLGLNASPRWLLPAALASRSALSPAAHRQYVAPFAAKDARRGPYALALALGGEDPYYASLWAARAALGALPLTMVWGERDPAFGAAHLARWTEAFPHARVVRLKDVGHFPAEEAPDAVARAISDEGDLTTR